MQASSISESRIFRMPSDYFPGKVQPGIASEHILRTGSYPENVFQEIQESKQGGGRHRLATCYISNGGPQGDHQLADSRKAHDGPAVAPNGAPLASVGARCQVHLTASSGLASSPRAPPPSFDGGSSPTKRSLLGAALPPAGMPQLSQRALFEAARDHMLADNEGDGCTFSPLSPGCIGTSRKLQELFGLFRDESLARPGSQAHDALLSQVAAEAESGEMDDLGDPSELHDLVSTESALTEVAGLTADYPPLSLPLASAPLQPAPSLPPPVDLGGPLPQHSLAPPMPTLSSSSMMSLDCTNHGMDRSATLAPPIHTTQIVLAPRSSSVPEVPRLPPHLATGPPSPKRHPSGAITGGRRSGLEVAAGGVAKRSSVSRRDEEPGSQRAGEDGSKPKPKRAAGERRPRRMTCNYCKTHVTPQWRCGPDGPRTLCNACGVRWGKGKLELNGIPHHAHR